MSKAFLTSMALCAFISSCSHIRSSDLIHEERTDIIEAFEIEGDEFKKFETLDENAPRESRPADKVDAPEKNESVSKNKKRVLVKKKTLARKKKEPKIKLSLKKKAPQKKKNDLISEKEQKRIQLYKKWDKDSKGVWAAFSPVLKDGELLSYNIKYLGIIVGEISMKTNLDAKVGGKAATHFRAELKSADYYSYIYRIRDSVDTYVVPDTFLPIKFGLRQRESKQSVDDMQLFDRETLQTYHWYKRVKKDRNKNVEKKARIPFYSLDSFAPLYFLRGLPLEKGARFKIPVVTRGKVWQLRVHVEDEERIRVNKRIWQAWKVEAHTHYPGVLKKSGKIYFWFAKRSDHLPLKFEAKVKVGAVSGELIRYD